MATSDDRRHDTNTSTFGETLLRLRLAADLTQEELAERAGVSARLISDIERGLVRRSRRDTIRMLADGLGLDGAERDSFSDIARGKRQLEPTEPATALNRDRIPAPPGAIVGREREISATTSLLMQPEIRLLTLTGPGGVGKTRLALETTHRVSTAFPDGAAFVDLSPLADHDLVLPTVRRSLDIEETPGITPLEQLVEVLCHQRLLLVLDNLEHLPGVVPALGRLLEQCPELTILSTSRQALHLRAEREYPVHPLVLPDPGAKHSLDELGRVPAVELFVRRAEAVRPSFALTEENAPTVAEIAVRLDGLPLAIELAAARLRVLTPDELLDRLERRLPLLTGGPIDLPDRHQTLRATIDWSYELLSPDEQHLFHSLAVFAGGFTLDAAESIHIAVEEHGTDPLTTLDLVTSLADKQLLHTVDHVGDKTEPGVTRFAMLETIREYALERLAASSSESTVRSRHVAWCVQLAERSQTELTGAHQAQWLARMEQEHDNLRAALEFTIGHGIVDPALRLCGSLYRFWVTASHFSEGRTWTERALALPDDSPSIPRASSLLGAGVLAYFQGDYKAAEDSTTQALELYQALGDTTGTAYAFGNLGLFADVREEYEQAVDYYSRALAAFRELGDEVHASFMLSNLGLIAYFQEQYDRAIILMEEALEIQRGRGDRDGIAITLGNMGNVYRAQGQLRRAEQLHRETLKLRMEFDNKSHLARSIESLGLDAAAQRQWTRGALLLGASEALRAELGVPLPPKDYEEIKTALCELRARLGTDKLEVHQSKGAAMTLDDIIELALETESGRDQKQSVTDRSHPAH